MSHRNSDALWVRAQKVLAGGPSTLSKHPLRFPQGHTPLFLTQGAGATVWDVDGNRYIDCIGALGPILLGHNHPTVTDAVRSQATRFASSSMSTALEVEVAERLVEVIPGAEQCRFGLNGKDVTEAAVKAARFITGKKHLIYVGYHGGFSDYLITTTNAGGILPQIQPYNHQVQWGDPYGLLAALQWCQEDLAGIMLEVPPVTWGAPESEVTDILARYKEVADAHGALFLLDEVVTWGRYGMGGAQHCYGIHADLVCLSKALGNGYPIAALCGPRDYMRVFEGGKVFLSTTFGANPIGLTACKAVLKALPHEYEALVEHGGKFGAYLAGALKAYDVPCGLRGTPGRMALDWCDCEAASAAQLKTLWMQEMLRHGVLVGIVVLPMTAWTAETAYSLSVACEQALRVISEVVHGRVVIDEVLKGPVVGEVFQRDRGQA